MNFGQAWRDFHATPHGRAALADLFTWCNVYNPIDEHDPIKLAKAEGERAAALRIIQLMNLKIEDFADEASTDARMLDRIMGY